MGGKERGRGCWGPPTLDFSLGAYIWEPLPLPVPELPTASCTPVAYTQSACAQRGFNHPPTTQGHLFFKERVLARYFFLLFSAPQYWGLNPGPVLVSPLAYHRATLPLLLIPDCLGGPAGRRPRAAAPAAQGRGWGTPLFFFFFLPKTRLGTLEPACWAQGSSPPQGHHPALTGPCAHQRPPGSLLCHMPPGGLPGSCGAGWCPPQGTGWLALVPTPGNREDLGLEITPSFM